MKIPYKEHQFSATAKQLFISILATVISIALTFGTARWVENRQKEKTRRMMAMMVINDIDESIGIMKDMITWEEDGRAISMLLKNNIDSLDKFSLDTLANFINYLIPDVYNPAWEFDKSNETIFNSSQESWNTLSDMNFIRNVQRCYHYRSLLEREREEWIYFQKPISKEASYDMIMNVEVVQDETFFVPLCRKLLNDDKVMRYVENSYWRCYLLNNLLAGCMELNDSNRFLMNITDEQLEEFARQTVEEQHKPRKKEIIGEWECNSGEDFTARMTFNKDRTMTQERIYRYPGAVYTGKICVSAYLKGTWEMKRDSLIRYLDIASLEVTVDDSGISYRPENEKIVKQNVEIYGSDDMKEYILGNLKEDSRVASPVYLNANGKKLELSDNPNFTLLYTRVK